MTPFTLHRLGERDHLVPRPLRGLRARMQAAWIAATAKQQRAQQARGERMGA